MVTRTELHRRFTLFLLQAMGISSAFAGALSACGGNVVVDVSGEGGGSTGGGGAGGGTGGSTTSSSTTTTTSTPCGVTGAGTPKDVCIPMDGDTCLPASSDTLLQILAKTLGVCAEVSFGDCCNTPNVDEVLCEHPPSGNTCCYTVDYQDFGACIGRPFTVAGAPRLAPKVARDDWNRGDLPCCEGLDDRTRRALAKAWENDARAEHASVASFARLALELMSVGAPSELVAGAQRAMGDEIRHAELSFAIAGAYGGEKVGPGPLAIDGALGRTSLAEIAAAAVTEGCIGETIAALLATEASAGATDPAVREALSDIAAEEADHAAFGWQLVAWAFRSGDPEVRAAIGRAFEGATVPAIGPVSEGVDLAAFRGHGRLSAEETRDVAVRAMGEVIQPAFTALRAFVA